MKKMIKIILIIILALVLILLILSYKEISKISERLNKRYIESLHYDIDMELCDAQHYLNNTVSNERIYCLINIEENTIYKIKEKRNVSQLDGETDYDLKKITISKEEMYDVLQSINSLQSQEITKWLEIPDSKFSLEVGEYWEINYKENNIEIQNLPNTLLSIIL